MKTPGLRYFKQSIVQTTEISQFCYRVDDHRRFDCGGNPCKIEL